MKRILIADDEAHLIRVLKLALERAGYTVESVPDGARALARIREAPPDVLITDIAMPNMTGQELCRLLEDEMPDRAFIVIVASSRTELEHREWSAGMSGVTFFEKPLSLRRLTGFLSAHFAGADQADAD